MQIKRTPISFMTVVPLQSGTIVALFSPKSSWPPACHAARLPPQVLGAARHPQLLRISSFTSADMFLKRCHVPRHVLSELRRRSVSLEWQRGTPPVASATSWDRIGVYPETSHSPGVDAVVLVGPGAQIDQVASHLDGRLRHLSKLGVFEIETTLYRLGHLGVQ